MPVKDINELNGDLNESPLNLSNDPNINKALLKAKSELGAPIVNDPINYGEGLSSPLISPQVPIQDESARKLAFSNAELGILTQEDINRMKSQEQTAFGDIIYRAPIRTAAKIPQEILKGIGLTVGGLAWTLGGANKNDMGLVFDNAFNKGVDDVFNTIVFENEAAGLKVFTPKRVQDGSLLDNLGSTSFWASEGADAAGFFLSMLVPGMLISKLGTGAKVASGLGKVAEFGAGLGEVSEDASALVKGLRKFGSWAMKPADKLATMKTAANIDNYIAAGFNTVVEAGAEASGVYTDVKNALLAKGEDQDIANRVAANKATSVFNANLAILLGPNIRMQQLLFAKADAKIAEKSILESIDSNAARLKGLNVAKSKEFRSDFLEKTLEGIFREGFYEEGMQTATQKYFTNKGISEDPNKKEEDTDGVLGSSDIPLLVKYF